MYPREIQTPNLLLVLEKGEERGGKGGQSRREWRGRGRKRGRGRRGGDTRSNHVTLRLSQWYPVTQEIHWDDFKFTKSLPYPDQLKNNFL